MQDLQYSVHGAAASARFFQMAGTETTAAGFVDRRLRPHPQQSLKCPRCDSPNTKFCYYNNYNLSQPRHFCKSCRRYWTKGGVLRNVPVGGGCRKSSASRRSSSSSSSSSGANSSSSNASSPKTSSSSGSDTTATVTIPPPPPPPPLPPPPATVMEAPGIFEEANTTTHLMISPTGYNSFSDFYTLENINPPPLPPPLDVQDLRFMEETVGLDLHHPLLDGRSGGSDELTSIDWQGCLDATAGFFDPAAPVTAGIGDHGLFWSHNSSNSQPLFFHDR